MSRPDLSPVMTEALEKAKVHGHLVRLPGGFWVMPGAKWVGNSYDWSTGANTVQALVNRARLNYTEWQEGRSGRFPIKAAVAA